LNVHGPILSVMARGAVVAISVHAGWIGGKCRLARLTIASGFGEGIDGSYRGYRRSVFLNRSVAMFSWSNSRQENPKTVREFLEKGRDLAECIPCAFRAWPLPMFFGGQVRQR
jgi:hypothetical protein